MIGWAVALLLSSTPYEDARGRFRLDLEPGFEVTPRFGDTRGIRFQKPAPARRGWGPLVFEVRMEAPGACGAGGNAFRDVRGRRWAKHTGVDAHRYERLEASRCLVVRTEGAARDLRRAAPALLRMLASVELTSIAQPAPRSERRDAEMDRLVGTWTGDGTRLMLGAGGGFRLGEIRGRWKARGGTLELEARQFSYVLRGSKLTLRGGGLEAALVFHRLDLEVEKAEEAKAPARLVGRWKGPGFELILGPEGRFELGAVEGQWRLVAKGLELRHGETVRLTYRVRLDGDQLRLSGADLEAPIMLARVEAPKPTR